MTSTAYLRVYQPLSSFPSEEQERFLGTDTGTQAEPDAGRRWLISAALPAIGQGSDGAFVREVDGTTYVCPFRTRLRMLAGLLAFRGSIPEEVADAFVPEALARRAAAELEDLGEQSPEVRSHILHANWYVPLRWFAAFEGAERVLIEDTSGLRIRYETRLGDATTRLGRALTILEASWIEDSVVTALRELLEWLDDFDEEGLLELDYGSVARMFDHDELAEDRSAEEVWVCLDSLEEGDVARAGRIFGALSDRWTEMRAREVVN